MKRVVKAGMNHREYERIVEAMIKVFTQRAKQARSFDAWQAYWDAVDVLSQLSPFELDVRPGKRQRGKVLYTHVQVSLDGKPLDGCVAADTKRGVALAYRTTPTGRLVTSKDKPVIDTLYGKVEVQDLTE